MMIPGDATFKPYVGPGKPISGSDVKSPVNGRVVVLKFSSSSQRYLFWLQAKPSGDASKFSLRELRNIDNINELLQQDDMDYDAIRTRTEYNNEGDDGDATMEDVESTEEQNTGGNPGPASSGGAQGGSSNSAAPGGGASGGRA